MSAEQPVRRLFGHTLYCGGWSLPVAELELSQQIGFWLSCSSVQREAGRWIRHGRRANDNMKTYCVYNQTRECFLSLNVKAADTVFSRLKGLIGKFKLRSDEGLWVVPSQGVHTFGLLFPLDLIYLDENYRVIHLVEYLPSFRIGPLKTHAESVLELPTHAIYSSHTQTGDQFVICRPEEMEHRLKVSAMVLSERVE
jgi:uncharacterized membrane protein (UPF0127 family)